MELRRSGNIADRVGRSRLVQQAPGCFGRTSGAPGAPALLLGALGRGRSLGAGGEWVTICRPPAPQRAPAALGRGGGVAKVTRPEGRSLRRRRIPHPPHREDRWSWPRRLGACSVYRCAVRMRLTICTLLCAGALGEWRTGGGVGAGPPGL